MYSFDIFDTLIIRTTAEPQGIYALMKEQLAADRHRNKLEDYIIENFFELRIHSEELIRKSKECQNVEEISLQDIYRAMAASGLLSEEQMSYLCSVEEELEIAGAIAIPENIKRIKNLLQHGERVVLISDMYLPTDVIRKILINIDEIFSNIPIYVSSEYGMRKTTGNLYQKVQEIEQVNYQDWNHIGDNIFQDIEMASRFGIRVEAFPRIELTDLENELLKRYGDDGGLQLMIGTAVNSDRAYQREAQDSDKKRAYHIGCRYVGPILYSYVEWIVCQAVKRNLKRLYFIARDGYLIKKQVDTILKRKKITIETKYIYGSRKAWRMPSLSEEHYNLYQLIWWSHAGRIHTLNELAEVLHVPLRDLYDYLPGVYVKNRKNNEITNQELEYIASRLEVNREFKNFHLQKLKQERKLAQEYLTQEVDVSDDYFAFVDVSGGGLTQGCLRELIKERYSRPIHTFFFKTDRVNLVEESRTDVFMPSFLENNLIVEMMCRAPHGQTKGYRKREGIIVPELEKSETDMLLEHGFYEYEKGILDFTERMCEVSEAYHKNIGSIRNILLYLKHIAQEPSEELLEYFASMPNNESGRGKETIEYAPRLTEHEIKEIFLRRTDEPVEFFYKGTNLNYSIMRAAKRERELIEWCKREHDSTWGRLYRQESELARKELCKRYGRAAFYPVRLLDEKVVIYGAGKFGQDLYNRLKADSEHEVILWVDKNAQLCRQQGMTEVCDVSEITGELDAQIVIAVMAENMADEIRKELRQMGVCEKRLMWIQPYMYPISFVKWKLEKIG